MLLYYRMIYLRCTTCGEILANKVIVYENKLKKYCEEFNIDYDMISQGLDEDEDYVQKRSELVTSLCRRPCCRKDLLTFVDIVKVIQ